MSKEQFIELHLDQGREPNWEKCPPGVEDFPYDVQIAINTYGKYQDRIVPDVGYIGKDFTLFSIIKQVENVENESLYLEALLQIDSFFIAKSQEQLEEARRKAKVGKK